MKKLVTLLCLIVIAGTVIVDYNQCRGNVVVREAWWLHQNKYQDFATDLHFKLWQKEDNIEVVNATVRVLPFTVSVQRGNQPEPAHSQVDNMPGLPRTNDPDNGQHAVDVVADNGVVTWCTWVRIEAAFELTAWNTKRVANINWTRGKEYTKACPDFGWTIDWPRDLGTGQYKHRITIANDDATDAFTIKDLKFLPTMAYYDSLESVVFSVEFPDSEVSLAPGGAWTHDLETTGDLVGGHIYGHFTMTGAKAGDTLGEDYFDHEVSERPSYGCIEPIQKIDPGRAYGLEVGYSGANGTIRDPILTGNPPGCGTPDIDIVGGGNGIRFTWPTACVNQDDVVQYQFTVDYPCDEIQPPASVQWFYEDDYPTLSQWLLIILALSVGAFFVWQLMRRRKAAASV